MENDEKKQTNIETFDIETSDLMLQKLGDIESLLTMRLQQAKNQGVDNKEDVELVQQLLAKIANATPQIKKVNSAAEFVTNFLESIKGDPGESGKDCNPLEVAAILKESEDFLNLVKGEKGDSVKGDPGEPGKPGEKGDDGKTPEKGKDYLTQSEIDSFKDDVVKTLENGLPTKIKIAVREFIGSDVFTQKVQKLINDKKTTIKDVQGLSEAIKAEIETVYDSVREYTSRSGGGNPQLSKMEDIDWNTIGDGLAIKWDATKKKFVFGTAGGGAVASVNGQTGTVVLTTSDISEGTNLYFTNARAIGALSGQNVSMFSNDAGYITSVSGGDHGTLSGLGDDDHTQYALLAGRSGGQIIKGGTAVTDVLTLVGTSGNGTLTSPAVQINVGNNGATNAITVLNNGRVGVGTTSPESLLDVDGAATFGTEGASSAQLVVKGGVSGNPMITLKRTVGPTIQYSWALAGGGLSFSDDTNGFIPANIFGDFGINQFFIGQRSKTISDTRPSLLSGTTFGSTAGTDVVASDLRIQSGLGTGAAVSPAIRFYTAVVGSSGTTPQSAAERMVISGTGNVGIGTTSPTAKLDINSDVLRLRTAKTPATSGASGNQGDIAWDSSYIYVCVATNTWERAALSTW